MTTIVQVRNECEFTLRSRQWEWKEKVNFELLRRNSPHNLVSN